MKHMISSDATQIRVAKWLNQAKPLDQVSSWTERRMVIQFQEHVYPLSADQVFQCAHCGHYDPKWTVTEVINFFEETFGIKPTEIEVTVSVAGYDGKTQQ